MVWLLRIFFLVLIGFKSTAVEAEELSGRQQILGVAGGVLPSSSENKVAPVWSPADSFMLKSAAMDRYSPGCSQRPWIWSLMRAQ